MTVTNADEPATVTLSNRQPEVGVRITANLDNPDGSARNDSWKWEQCASLNADSTVCSGTLTNIVGATSATFEPTEANLNQYLQATVTYTDSAMGENLGGTNVDESKSDTASMASAFVVQAKTTTNATPQQFADHAIHDTAIGTAFQLRHQPAHHLAPVPDGYVQK